MKYQQLVSMPSAVSDWLEEQLEARGIDAVVYTHYVLSLLHSSSVDVIHPDEDLQLSHLNKEVRQPRGRHSHLGQQSDWRRYADIDAEQLKRSAAVQCLLSASDQNCGIESLIDELCEKLKKVSSESTTSSDAPNSETIEHQKVSPQELAKQYYKAFPALSRSIESSAKVISLPKWISLPKKESNKKQTHSSHIEDKIRCKSGNMKARFSGRRLTSSCRSRKRNILLTRNMARSLEFADGMEEMEYGDLESNRAKSLERNCNMDEWEDVEDILDESNRHSSIESFVYKKPRASILPNNRCDSSIQNDESDLNMYEDLPVNLDFLDSPAKPRKKPAERMIINVINDTPMSDFIPYGVNTSSVWSNKKVRKNDLDELELFNKSLIPNPSESFLNAKFGNFTINSGDPENNWPVSLTRKEGSGFTTPDDTEISESRLFSKWKEDSSDEAEEAEDPEEALRLSLCILNHSEGKSPFCLIVPKASGGTAKSLKVYAEKMATVIARNFPVITSASEKDDLLNSARSHFVPIPVLAKHEALIKGKYEDGTTFQIVDDLDKVDYKRSETGTMYLESEYGTCKKYYEYKRDEEDTSLSIISSSSSIFSLSSLSDVSADFVLKFNVCQNDKACQTEASNDIGLMETEGWQLGCFSRAEDVCGDISFEENDIHQIVPDNVMTYKCTCANSASESCPLHPSCHDSMPEIQWKLDTKRCEKCNTNTVTWNSEWLKNVVANSVWNNENLRNIWKEGEICQACSNVEGGRSLPSEQHTRLRQDIKRDGEQLLSDISNIHDYLRDMREASYDISQMVSSNDRKRRHSMMTSDPNQPGSGWSCGATRFVNAYVAQMSQIPTLRAVTL